MNNASKKINSVKQESLDFNNADNIFGNMSSNTQGTKTNKTNLFE